MAVITGTDLAKRHGANEIFNWVSFSLPNRARAAIVGPNGIGKTTLLRIIAGEETPSGGSVHIAKGARLGYLPQEAGFEAVHSLWEECLQAFTSLRESETELARLEQEMGENPNDEELIAEYGDMQANFEHAGGYTYETRIRTVLSGLGFNKPDYALPLSQLSGGQRTRALLARLLLDSPDVLILDEPTNHLDIAAVEWLESHLRDWDGAILIVSHDRYFLDRVASQIWEMSPTGFETYRGNYSRYLKVRAVRWDNRIEIAKREIARMEKELAYIRKNISGQRTQQAKGKLSRLSREIMAVEKLGFEVASSMKWSKITSEEGGAISRRPMKVEQAAQRLSALRKPSNSARSINLQMRSKERSGGIILQASDLQIGYPGKLLFTAESLELHRLECAALIGPNGSGKTTFLRTLLEDLEPLGGKLRLGENLKVGYFAQAHEDLDPALTLIEEIAKVGTTMLEKDIRQFLGRFMFSGDDQYKKVSVLSGGERGRLALAKLSLLDANFLLLDEPSNHLDIPAQEILQQVMAEFDGTILLVSHDRYLIDALATQIWEIDAVTSKLSIYKGSYSESRGVESEQPAQVSAPTLEKDKLPSEPDRKKTKTLSKNEVQRIKAKISQLEDRILAMEEKMEGLAKKLQNPPSDPTEIQKIGEDYAYIEVELTNAIGEWETLSEQV